MKLQHRLAITAVAAACSLGSIELNAAGADAGSPNPPRTQQEMMKERYAACRDLHGPALRECMSNYVGTPDKNLQQDQGTGDDTSAKPSAPARPPKDVAPAQEGAPRR